MIVRKRAFSERTEPNVAAECCSSARHEQSHPFPCLRLCAALLVSLPDRQPKNRCSNVLLDKMREWLPRACGMSVHCDLLSRMPRLAESFDKVQSISTLCSPFSRQMTITHPIPIPWLPHHSHQGRSAFRSRRAALLLFFIHSLTVLRDTANVLCSPRKLLRSSYALKISSRRSSEYACGVGFSRLCL